MSDASAGSGVPAIRTFQFDSSSIGQISSSVNLFRGDVNIPQTLFSLPSRHSGSGLDINFSIFYQSNVFQAAELRNLEAPTSVVGLGWDLPLTFIKATSNGSPDPDTRSYTLNDNGGSNALIRQAVQPFLFHIPAAIVNTLQNGKPVTPQVRAQFLELGLPLDAGAIAVGAKGTWTLTDDVYEQCFVIEINNASISNVCYGGQAFQLRNYSFWHIVYFPMYERWLIVTDDGIRKSFGGGIAKMPQGYATSAANSVAWQVWWTLKGIPAWTGPSALTTGQKQVARAWYLVSASDPFGDAVTYQYNGWARSASGLIPDVEQQVGSGGLPYTKAVYLTHVTDVFGRTVTATYGDKLWSSATDASPREYADPHRATPSNEPNAYQDCYETKYLDKLVVSASNGAAVFSVRFGYSPRPGVQGPEQEVANVNSFTGPLQGDTFKRYLTSVVMENGEGASLPGFRYDYYLDPSLPGAQPGAVRMLTFPQGGQASYTYNQRQDLSQCNRAVTIPKSKQTPSGSPRVFYGDNYVVTLWFDPTVSVITLQVWSWYGRWVSWQPSAGIELTTDTFDSTTIDVIATSQFFAVSFDRGSDSVAYVFNKASGSPGQFVEASVNGLATPALAPTVTFSGAATMAGYYAGSNFFAVSIMDPVQEKWQYDVFTYSWISGQWTQHNFTSTSRCYLATSGEYLVAVDSNGVLTLRYLNGALEWNAVPALSVPAPGVDPTVVALTAGSGCCVVNIQTGSAPTPTNQILIIQWDANHIPELVYNKSFTAYQSDQTTLQPIIVSNSLVAVNGILLRYNGATWIANTNLVISPMGGDSPEQRYAYAADYALQIVVDQGNPAGAVLGYDPNADVTSWNTEPGTANLPMPLNPYDNFPAAADDYAVLGPYIYYRGSATDWTQLCSNPQHAIATVSALSAGFDSQSLVNEGPYFFSYADVPTNGGNTTVQSVVLKNAQVVGNAAVPFPDEKMYTASLEQTPGPGKSPQGPNLFVTYPITDATFDTASSITLHQYAGAAVRGPLAHYPIAQLSINDRYQDVSVTTYVPDPSQAACDATGLVIKYYETAVYPGSDATKAAYGKTVNTYVNGLNIQGGNYLDMLDGLLLETAIYDASGNLLESKKNTWRVLNEVAYDPRDRSAPLIRLYGGWTARTEQTKVVDGVSTTEKTSFIPAALKAPYTGRAAAVTSQSFNGSGIAETWTKSYTYGVEVNSSLLALNMRSAMAQGTATEQLTSRAAVTVRSSASVFSMWPSSVAPGVLAPAQEASFNLLNASDSAFPYSVYTPGSNPAGWLLDHRALQRTARGQVIEQVDGCGIATSVIYSTDLTFPVAHFTNASAESAVYLGFEPYESAAGWTLSKTTPETNDVRTGASTLRLPGGASASVSVSVIPKISAKNYVVAFWYKTLSGFQPAAGAQCIVACGGQSFSAAFQATGGKWTLATIGVPVPSSLPAISVALTNSAAQDVLLDSVYAMPLPGTMLARTYNPVTQNYTSTMDAGGRTRWTYYDPFGRPSIQIGPNGSPKELALRFLSRQGSSSDTFEASSPNAEVTLHPAGGGTMETFLDGLAWQNNWQPDKTSNWQSANGSLKNIAGSSATLTSKGTLPTTTWAVYFETTLPPGSPALSITAGNVTVAWSRDAYTCTAAGQPINALVAPPKMGRHWLLVAGDGLMLFFADGQLIFSQTGKFAYGTPVISVGPGLGVTHLATLALPRVGLSYNDGSSRQRQVHQMYGADCRVSEKIFDALDRLVATTRVAPGSFGQGASSAPLQYRASFVDVQGFLNNFKSTGAMTGDVADYYAGQSENGVSRSNDQKYPYYGTLWESSPRGRRIEHGLPGKPYAIADFGSTTSAQRATTQFAYRSNVAGDSSLPPGQYTRTSVTTPLKSTAVSFQDQRGQGVATWQLNTAGNTTTQSAGLRTYTQASTGPESTLALNMPNAILAGPQSNGAAFARTTVADGAGRAIYAVEPNSGKTQFLHDPCGRVRFVQAALDPGEQGFFYNKYDALGRLLEQGMIPQLWNPQTLGAQAANMSWPDASVARTVTFLWSYDGDGGTSAQIGQKTSCVTTTAGPKGSCETTEVFTYDSFGRLVDVAMSVKAGISAAGTTSYAYNNLGELIMLTQPAGSPLKRILYTVNDQGWITAIGTAPNTLDSIAAYTYNIEGNVETESLGGKWMRTAQYLSPGWARQVVTKSSDGKQSLSLSYTYNADRTIATRKIDYAFAALSGSLADIYTYDGQGRLDAAAGSSNDQVTSYDPNGNIWAVKQDGNVQSFPCAAGKDQLSQTQISGHVDTVKYDARGRMTAGLNRTLTYDNTTNLTTFGNMGSAAVQFGYGSHGQRVLKMISGASESVYVTGASALPIARVDSGVWSAMIYGPTGLVAFVSDQTYYPLKDQQQSVWAVVNSTGLIARYVYLPFGGMVADGPNPNVSAYRFMGQEWDAELELFNFHDRMYDPILRRFLAPDTGRQFPSPYVFCGNSPLNTIDPSGDTSVWARVGIGAGMALAIIAGIALSIVTLGAATPAVVAADTAAVGTGIAGEGATAGIAAGVEAGTEGAAATVSGEGAVAGGTATGQAAAEGGSATASEVGVGASSGEAAGGSAATPAAEASSGWVTAGNLGIQVLAGTVQGAGTSGLQYDIQHNRDFTVAGFFESVGWGAAGGALGAGMASPLGFFDAAINEFSLLGKYATILGVNGVAGAGSSGVTTVLSNLAHHETWYAGLLQSVVIGAGEGVALSGLGEGFKARESIGQVGEETLQKLNSGVTTMVDKVVAASKTQAGTGALIVGGFFAGGGILFGGVLGPMKRGS